MSIDSSATLQTEAADAPDTIVAISTPPGRGGIGIVRLSGPSALALVPHLVSHAGPLTHARAQIARVLDPHRAGPINNGKTEPKEIYSIDDAVVTTFHGPHSY